MCVCKHHYLKSALCTCTCESHKDARKVEPEPEFVVGQQVSGDDYKRLPVESRVQSAAATAAYFTKVAPGNAWAYTDGVGNTDSPAALAVDGPVRILIHLPEPEDTDDELADWERALLADAEPEPLKEGDWVQVWAQVDKADPDDDGEILLKIGRSPSNGWLYVKPDTAAIVRPAAGQVPPWVKPARCTSLKAEGHGLVRCTALGSHEAHRDGLATTWTDKDEAGRITEGGAS